VATVAVARPADPRRVTPVQDRRSA